MRTWHLIGTAFSLLLASDALAQPQTQIYRALCDDAATVVEALKRGYGEEPIVAGRSTPESGEGTMTVTVNPLTKTWTIVVVRGGWACVIGGGNDFTIRPADDKHN